MFFEKNIQALNKYQKKIKNALKKDVSWNPERTSTVPAKNGETVLLYHDGEQTVRMNSIYSPSHEADRYMHEYYKLSEQSLFVMFGISNGSFAKALLSNTKREFSFLIYEPSIDIFMRVMHDIDLSDLLKDERVGILVEGINGESFFNVVDSCIENYNYNANMFIKAPKYQILFPDALEDYAKTINDVCVGKVVMRGTIHRSGSLACKNYFENMKRLKNNYYTGQFCGAFPKDMPAVLVAAGPSLEKNIEGLKDIKGKAFIAVVDSALKMVYKHGIVPDLIVCLDYEKPVELFDIDGLGEVPFLIFNDINPDVIEFVKPKKLIFDEFRGKNLKKIIHETGVSVKSKDIGGSVATFLLSTLTDWGFKHIILMGQDLAMTDDKVHAGEESRDVSDYGVLLFTEGINGGKVITGADFYTYIKWYGEFATRHKEVEIIDATEGGALKKGTTVMTLREAAKLYCTNEYDVSGLIDAIQPFFNKNIVLRFCESLGDSIKALNKTEIQCRKGISLCKEANAILARGQIDFQRIDTIVKQIGKVDNSIKRLDEYVYVLMTSSKDLDAFGEGLFDDEEDDLAEVKKIFTKSEKYYADVAETIPIIVDRMQGCIEALSNENE